MSVPVLIWRIGVDAPTFEAHHLAGKGAEITGGRWNHAGTPLVYSSSSRALACLETVVHLGSGDPLPLNRYLVEIAVPAAAWELRSVLDHHAQIGWDARPAGKVSVDWGTDWAAGRSALLAEVPSVIVPEEYNILINPLHPDVASLRAVKVRRWTYDARLG